MEEAKARPFGALNFHADGAEAASFWRKPGTKATTSLIKPK